MSDARIYDLGYRHYDGARTGTAGAVRSLIRYSFKALLGVRRGVWAKLLNVVIAGMAYVPAIAFVGLAVFLPRQLTDAVLPATSDYLGFVSTAVLLFVATGVPLALCPDRRHGTLALYLASPLDRDTYLLAKAAAIFGYLAIVTIGPALLLILGLTVLDAGPQGVVAVIAEMGRAIASGMLMSLMLGGLAMALSSLTDRRGAAAGFIILWLLASQALVQGVLVAGLELPDEVMALDVVAIAFEAAQRVHGTADTGAHGLETWYVAATATVWVLATAWVVRWRYQRIQVTR